MSFLRTQMWSNSGMTYTTSWLVVWLATLVLSRHSLISWASRRFLNSSWRFSTVRSSNFLSSIFFCLANWSFSCLSRFLSRVRWIFCLKSCFFSCFSWEFCHCRKLSSGLAPLPSTSFRSKHSSITNPLQLAELL